MRFPKRIDPCPIVDTILEFRFTTALSSEQIMGIFYNDFIKLLPKFSALPAFSVFPALSAGDNPLGFLPKYQFENDHFILRIAPSAFNFSPTKDYPGWEAWLGFNEKVFKIIGRNVEHFRFSRIGLRYINFFPYNLFDKLKISINVLDNEIASTKAYFRSDFEQSSVSTALQLANNQTINVRGVVKEGSAIDIDCTMLLQPTTFTFSKDASELASKMHQVEKETFFNLLKDSFLQGLNPEY